jgi:hypothetical protein
MKTWYVPYYKSIYITMFKHIVFKMLFQSYDMLYHSHFLDTLPIISCLIYGGPFKSVKSKYHCTTALGWAKAIRMWRNK